MGVQELHQVREQLKQDLDALSRVGHRFAGSEGERAMLHEVRKRLPDGVGSRIEGFVAYTSPSFVLGVHALALLITGLVGLALPQVATVLCAGVTLHLAAELMGRFSLLRWVLPKSASYNLVVPIAAERPLGSIVVSAPLDIPRWRPSRPRWLVRPAKAVFVAAIVVTAILLLRSLAEPWGRPTQGMYVASLLVLGAAVALGAVAHRRSGGDQEDASGAAALIQLTQRLVEDPPPGLDVWVVFTGCGHAYQNGMHAFLAMRRGRLPDPVLVLALDHPGQAPMGAVISEGPLFAQRHRSTGPALIERLRWAGVSIPSVDRPSVTDARAALLWGYRALALSGGGGISTPTSTLRAVGVAEAVVRLYAEDLARVPDVDPSLREVVADPSDDSSDDPSEDSEPPPEAEEVAAPQPEPVPVEAR